jgi:threonine dehydratase
MSGDGAPLPIIIGAEPTEAADAYRSKLAGELQGHTSGPPSTIADGLKTTLGPNTWPIVRDLVAAIVTVSEEEIKGALRLVYERAKLAIEPSAAVGVAVATSSALGVALRAHLPSSTLAAVEAGERKLRVGIVLCGGNSDYKG